MVIVTIPQANVGKIESGNLVLQSHANGFTYVNFPLAVTQGFGDNKTTAWYKCVAYNDVAKRMVKAGIKQGSRITVTGEQTFKLFDKNDGSGDKGYSLNIKVLAFNYVGGPSKSGNGNNSNSNGNSSNGDNVPAPPHDNGSTEYEYNLDDDDLPY